MDEWNSLVDEYINLKGSARDGVDIELEAKVGLDGGPLHKHCSACGKFQGRDVASLMRCSGCSVVRGLSLFILRFQVTKTHVFQELYCSQSCQKADWKGHKKACKLGCVKPQRSSSQYNLEGLIQAINAAQAAGGTLGKAEVQ